MEPEHNVTQVDVEHIHKFFDSDSNGKVTLQELI